MLETILSLIGITLGDYHISDDVLFTVASLVLLFCLGYVFHMFQVLIERCTSRK